MLANIFSAIEKLGLTAQKRAIHVQFSNPSLNQEVFLQRIDGQHTLNEGVKADLICFPPMPPSPSKNSSAPKLP